MTSWFNVRASNTELLSAGTRSGVTMNLDATLLEILVCPDCRSTLSVDDAASELVCDGCGLAYPVRDDIPVMLIEEARRPEADTAESPGDEDA
jgi:uncharacterized protein YbaR (Trm112 family)